MRTGAGPRETDGRVIAALGDALAGSDRPLVIMSGVGMGSAGTGQLATEDVFNPGHANPRVASELAGAALSAAGVNVSVMRLPQVHDTVKQGLITVAVAIARETRVSAYVRDGLNRWPAAPVGDVARLYRLVLEKGEAGGAVSCGGGRGHRGAEDRGGDRAGAGVPVVALSEDETVGHFGWFGACVGMDVPASGARTRERLGWTPVGRGLIADLREMRYLGG